MQLRALFTTAVVKKQCTLVANTLLQSITIYRTQSSTTKTVHLKVADMIPGAQAETFYKRKLPCPPATEFSSQHGIALFQEAFSDGTMLGFFKLVEQYRTQTEPAFCGLTSVAMVLNALSIDPRRTWKAPWRWFDETLLDCCKPLSLVQKNGLDLVQAACLARCNGAEVRMQYSGSFEMNEFRELVRECCTTGEQHLIAHYSRKTLSQTGDGHFSPVGGYHAGQDMVLILDTARFKYPPHWVPLELLFKAMDEVDVVAGRKRGYILMKAPERPISLCYTLSRSQESWTKAEQYIRSDAPKLFNEMASRGASLEAIVRELVMQCPIQSVQKFVAVRVSSCDCATDDTPQTAHLNSARVVEELQSLPLYQEVEKNLESTATASSDEGQAGQVTALLLLRTPDQWVEANVYPEIRQQLDAWMDLSRNPLIKTEIAFLKHQMDILVAAGELQAPDHNTYRSIGM